MLLSAAGMQAGASSFLEFTIPSNNGYFALENKSGGSAKLNEYLAFIARGIGLYWKGDKLDEPAELWLPGGEFTAEDKALAAELQKCEIKGRKNNFVYPQLFVKGLDLHVYNYKCLAEFASKHPGSKLQYHLTSKLWGDLIGHKVDFPAGFFNATYTYNNLAKKSK